MNGAKSLAEKSWLNVLTLRFVRRIASSEIVAVR